MTNISPLGLLVLLSFPTLICVCIALILRAGFYAAKVSSSATTAEQPKRDSFAMKHPAICMFAIFCILWGWVISAVITGKGSHGLTFTTSPALL